VLKNTSFSKLDDVIDRFIEMLELLVVVIAMGMLAFTLCLLDNNYPTYVQTHQYDHRNTTCSSWSSGPCCRPADFITPPSSQPCSHRQQHQPTTTITPDSESVVKADDSRRRYVWRLTVVKENGANDASATSGLLARVFMLNLTCL